MTKSLCSLTDTHILSHTAVISSASVKEKNKSVVLIAIFHLVATRNKGQPCVCFLGHTHSRKRQTAHFLNVFPLLSLENGGHFSKYCYLICLSTLSDVRIFFSFLDLFWGRPALKLKFLAQKSICGGFYFPHRNLKLVRQGDTWGKCPGHR